MKATCYLRVGKGKRNHVFAVSPKPSPNVIVQSGVPVPTIAFKLVLDIPDAAFEAAEVVIQVPMRELEIATEVKLP